MAGFSSIFDGALRSWIRHDPIPSAKRPSARSLFNVVVPMRGPPAANDPQHAADLAKMVEAEIIPRLMLSHRSEMVAPEAIEVDDPFGPGAAESFARMVLSEDSDSLMAFVGGLLQSGIPMETVYVDLMIPAARRLGDYWDDDSISFADVTIGLGRLQQVVRTLKWKPPQSTGPDHSSPSALFAPVSSEQHTFGLFIIEESFRRAGWRTWIETSGLAEDTIDMVQHHWFDLIGLSASSDTHIEELTAIIAKIRKASRNGSLFVLVGGRLFIDQPDLVSVVGADGTAPNGADALNIANNTIGRLLSNA